MQETEREGEEKGRKGFLARRFVGLEEVRALKRTGRGRIDGNHARRLLRCIRDYEYGKIIEGLHLALDWNCAGVK